MGIINITPDSFYAGSRRQDIHDIISKVEEMLLQGAAIIDIGGQSTRPGSVMISEEEELNRVIAPIHELYKKFPGIILSIDTFHAKVAKEAVEAGASIVNDISAGDLDPAMISTVASLHTPFVCMHMKGKPAQMQENPVYDDLTKEVLDFFIRRVDQLRQAGISDVIIDPGFGFGKTIEHNFRLLHDLPVFRMLDCPIMAGLSRKSTIYKTLGITAEQALNGTTVLNTIALMNGSNILRVHDVKEAMEVIKLVGKASDAF